MTNCIKTGLFFIFLIASTGCEKYQSDRAKFNPPEWTKGEWLSDNGRIFLINRGEFVDSENGANNQINGITEFLEDRSRKTYRLTFKDQWVYQFEKTASSSQITFEFQNLQNAFKVPETMLTIQP